MKTKYARQIREVILRAQHPNGPDWFWRVAKANEFQKNVFEQALLKMQLRDLREQRKRL